MAEIVNLRRERKRRERDEDVRKAAENRAKFGAPKAVKALEAARRERDERTLDGARREPRDEP